MIIRDEVYGTINIHPVEAKIIDTSDFQRLRKIKQMGFTYLVYPCATHTRFEHSLGTMHLSSVISERLGLDQDLVKKIRLYALLHDIGHISFSHDSETVVSKYLGNHEEIGRKLISNGEIADMLNENYSVKEILDVENSKFGRIISSDLGADRMDYLLRDAKNTGVAYGLIDYDRILHMFLMEDELMVDKRGLEAAESVLIARFMMFSTVYLHKTVRIAAVMYHRSLSIAIENNHLKPKELLHLSDEKTLDLLASFDSSKVYAEGLIKRRLFKEAYSIIYSENKNLNLAEFEENLRKKTKSLVLVEKDHDFFKPIDFKVKTEDAIYHISEISDIVKSLKTSGEKRRMIRIICPEKDREKIKNTLRQKCFSSEQSSLELLSWLSILLRTT